MGTKHPITPPPELIEDWIEIAKPLPQRPPNPNELVTLAARWGADQELEACCEWLIAHYWKAASEQLRATRRPKPPSLKAQALEVLAELGEGFQPDLADIDVLREALESLPD